MVFNNTGAQPSQITVKSGQFARLLVINDGTSMLEFVVKDMKPDNIIPDESLAGNISGGQFGTVQTDAQNGIIHLFINPQGSGAALFTANNGGNFQFTGTISGHQITGTINVQK